jgi:hypothetical protein
MHYNKHILVKQQSKSSLENSEKRKRKYSTEEVTPSIKINDNAIQNPKLKANAFSTA